LQCHAGRRVELCDRCEIEIRPHVGEFDFAAQSSRRLNYEREVFSALKSRFAEYDAIVEIGATAVVVHSLAKAPGGSQTPQTTVQPFEIVL